MEATAVSVLVEGAVEARGQGLQPRAVRVPGGPGETVLLTGAELSALIHVRLLRAQ